SHQIRAQRPGADGVLTGGDLHVEAGVLGELREGCVPGRAGVDGGDALELRARLGLGVADDDVGAHADRVEGRALEALAAGVDVRDLLPQLLDRPAMGHVGIGEGSDRLAPALGLATGIDGGQRHRLRLDDGRVDGEVASVLAVRGLGPQPPQRAHELGAVHVPIVMRGEDAAELCGLLRPPGRDHVARDAAAGDVRQGGRPLRGALRVVIAGPDRGEDLDVPGDRGAGGGQRPRLEARRLDALAVVEVELGHERELESEAVGERAHRADVVPGGRHAFLLDVAQEAAVHGGPVTESHVSPEVGRGRRTRGDVSLGAVCQRRTGASAGAAVARATACSAWARSARRSSGSSTPTERRMVVRSIPASARPTASRREWVVVAGWTTSERTSPMLATRANSSSASMNVSTTPGPPARSKEKTLPSPSGSSRLTCSRSGWPGRPGGWTRATSNCWARKRARSSAVSVCRRMRRSRVSMPSRICEALVGESVGPRSWTLLARARTRKGVRPSRPSKASVNTMPSNRG